MNQPTREEFEQLVERVKQIEQRTEEIKTVKVEVASEDVIKRLDALEQGQQEISRKQDEQFTHLKGEFASISKRQDGHDKGLFMHSKHIGELQEEVKGARADIANIQATQSDHGELLKNMATKDDISALKGDTSALKGDISALKTAQDEQHGMLHQILRLLGQKPGE